MLPLSAIYNELAVEGETPRIDVSYPLSGLFVVI
jgi:hypothetical protein